VLIIFEKPGSSQKPLLDPSLKSIELEEINQLHSCFFVKALPFQSSEISKRWSEQYLFDTAGNP